MNGYNKEEVKRDICRGHSARSDRELYRVCPSKLSKKELEDLYFSLLENNLDLKKTINGQQDKIKVLSTKVQRMTASQKNNLVRDAKDNPCCAYTKAMINEQKESIADLKKTNERMAERIRVLNMRLCSAKQFLRRSPVTSTSRCAKLSAAPMSLKNSTMSLINAKTSDINVKSAAVSSQCLDKDIFLSTRTVETETEDQEKENQENLCNENRCRSLMEELKQKIVDLQEELSKTHEEYSSRISRLESEVSDLHGENSCARVQRATDEQELRRRAEQAERLLARLRTAEGQYGELAAELSIEKRKVAELETRVKAVDMSCNVVKTIEEHLSNTNLVKNEIENQQPATSSPYFSPRWDKSSSRLDVPSETRGQPSDATDKAEQTKQSDDSGYSPKEEGTTGCINDQLNLRINVLQQQLDLLKLSAMNGSPKENHKRSGHRASKTLFLEESPSARLQPAPPAASGTSSAPVHDSLKNANYNTSQYSPDNVQPERDDAKGTSEICSSVEEVKAQDAGAQVTLGNLDRPLDSVSVNTALDNGVIKDNRDELAFVYQVNRNQAKDEYDSNLNQKTLVKSQNAKTDAHNSMQIPGPMPVDDAVTEIPSKYTDRLKRRQRNTGNKRNQGPKNSNNDSVSRGNAKKSSSVDVDADADLLQVEYENRDQATEEISTPGPSVTPVRAGTENEVIQVESVGTNGPRYPDTKKRCKSFDDYVETVESSTSIQNLTDKNGGASAVKASELSPTGKFMYDNSSRAANPNMFSEPNTARPAQAASQTEVDAPVELCGHYARFCTCSATRRRRDVSVFRTCSGTLRFRTRPSLPMKLKQCPCSVNQEDIKRSESKDTQTDVDPPPCEDGFRRRSQTYSKGPGQQTYSVSPRSPENTDHEISSLTDLPSEIDAKSPRDVLSPGEERATNTYTDSYSAPTTTEYGTLSEGELPGAGGAQRLSNGEAKVNFREAEKPTLAAQRMEDALAAITEELALCRELLQARHPERPLSKDVSLTTEACPGPIALKRAPASARIGDTFTPKCIFTLHIGTVVLSDEAVMDSHDMSLVLTWQFYDQNVTMARVREGRVVPFDFSTEYDVRITDQFLSYLKHEELQLMICELDKPNEPFASCALPLRDALLHTNRRVDMSLALVAGPRLRAARALRDTLDEGDEVGVLDLWCLLRVEPSLLPAINRAIARTRLSNAPPPSNLLPNMSCNAQTQYLEQVMDDDRSDVENLSTDLDMHLKRTQKHSIYDYDRHPVPDTKSGVSETLPMPPMPERASELEQTLQNQRGQVGFKDAETQSLSSQIIVNEVPTKIRSAYDMKQALDQNLDQNNLPPIATLGNIEEDPASQAYSTGSSWKNEEPKSEDRRKSEDKRRSEDRRRSEERNRSFPSFLQNNTRRSSSVKLKDIPQKIMRHSLGIEEPPELTRGLRNLTGSKKSVKYTDTAWDDKQERGRHSSDAGNGEYIQITVEWLALSEESEAMMNPSVQRLYVAYSFLGRGGADLETPVSLPKPTNYAEKCYFNFSRTFQLTEYDLPLLGHMARCRSTKNTNHDPKDCIVFTVISEPHEDPLGLDNCEDIGFAYLYLGDLLAYCAGSDSYSEVIPVLSARAGEAVCGVLAVRVDGLGAARRCVRRSER